jgi:uncharacterized OB-fold protein
MTERVVADGLMTGSRLLGGRRKTDGRIVFPLPRGVESDSYDEIELPAEGTLWSYTVQRFRPKTPYNGPGDEQNFTPYAVGYVELPGSIIVESRIETDDPARLEIGQRMAFCRQKFRTDADGSDVFTYAFRPIP